MTAAPSPGQLLYLEPDDEITSVIRRLRDVDPGRVVLVASGRTKATTSAVALRLLARVAAEDGREIALVADPNGRSLAAEAGIPAFASVAEASADDGIAVTAPPPAPRAPIRVVRGEHAPVAAPAPEPEPARQATPPARAIGPGDETQAVPVPPPPAVAPRPARRPAPGGSTRLPFGRRLPRAAVGVLIGLVLLAGAALAAVAPAATIVIEPASFALDPASYTLTLSPTGADSGQLAAEAQGTASGTFSDPSAATGTITIYNYTYVTVEIPQGMRVSANGEIFFTTTERVIAPPGDVLGLGGIQPGRISVGVVAEQAGASGNVAAEAINRIENATVDGYLKGFPGLTGRRVTNPEPTSGGDDNEQPQVTQEDVNSAVAEIQADLTDQLRGELAEDPGRVYGPADAGDPVIEVPEDLVGRTGNETFTLSGTLDYQRAYLDRTEVEQAGVERLLNDESVGGDGAQVLPDSAEVTVGDVTQAGEQLRVQVTVRADATSAIDLDAVRNQVAGMTATEAVEALGGDVRVKLWPDWIDRIPQLTWRIEVRITGESPSPEASP